jgi:hypothetical protein
MDTAMPTPQSIDAAWPTRLLHTNGHSAVRVVNARAEPIGTGEIGKFVRFTHEVTRGTTTRVARIFIVENQR